MFNCLRNLHLALIVIFAGSLAWSQVAPQCQLFSDRFQKINWDKDLVLALASAEKLLGEEPLSWIEGRFLKDASGREIDWAKVAANERRRIVGMLTPTYPAKTGTLAGNKTPTDIDTLTRLNPDKKTLAQIEALQDSLEWENLSAAALAKLGFYVIQNPDTSKVFNYSYQQIKAKSGVSSNRRPDYFILSKGNINEGRIFDHYLPSGDINVVVEGILNKTLKVMHDGSTQRQTNRVVINLMKNSHFNSNKFNLTDLRQRLRESSSNGNLEEVIVIYGRPPNILIERVFP